MLAQSPASFALGTLRYTPSGPDWADSPAATAESARAIPDGTAKAAHSLPSVSVKFEWSPSKFANRAMSFAFLVAIWSKPRFSVGSVRQLMTLYMRSAYATEHDWRLVLLAAAVCCS
jgi:hypothetical protein